MNVHTLRRGSRGEGVKLLQRLLAAAGCYLGPIDGAFGPATRAALEGWQRRRGLVVDGICGPKTWASFEQEIHLSETAGARYRLAPHFALGEFACNHCRRIRLRWLPELVDLLEQIRAGVGVPLIINSGYRCPTWNARQKDASPKSQHLLARATDLHFAGATVDQVADLAEELGAGGVGRYDWGVHVDIRPGRSRWDFR